MDNIDVLIDRARNLISMKRHEQAIQELNKVLTVEPSNYSALTLITACYIQLNDEIKTDEYTQKLLAAAPDSGLSYYYRAIYLNRIEKELESETMIRKAIELEPWDADFFGFLSAIYIDRKKWETALEYANEGLNADPENTACLNYRTICLTKLNRKEELLSSIEETLAQNPEDAYTHANVGWSKLETRNFAEAKAHFMEALKINPDNYHAKEGMKEAIRAKNPLYRFFMNYQFWIAKQQGKAQWMFILGMYFGTKFIAGLASKYPIFWAVYVPLMFFAYLTWIIEPFANIFLRFDSFGKYALDNDEKLSANITAFCLLIAIVSVVLYFSLDNSIFLYLSIYSITVVVPLSRFYMMSERKRVGLMTYYTFGLAAVGLLALIICFFNEGAGITIGIAYFIGFVAYQWISNYRNIS
jgi:tetratricopeptide (TPR) repeat protein